MSKRLQDLLNARTALEKEIEAAQREIVNPEYLVATDLHARLCHHNHTDGCDWHYDSWENLQNYSRKEYLAKARKLIAVEPDIEKLLKIISIL